MADIEEIRRKVDKLIVEKGLNYRDASLKIGRKDSYLQQYVKYGYPRRLKEIDRMRLAKLLDVDDIEIMDDEVIASKTIGSTNATLNAISDIIKVSCSSEGNVIAIDVLASQISEGKDFYTNVEGRHLLNKAVLEDFGTSDVKNIKIVKILNDVMKPTIDSGDSVWFDCSYKHPESDGLYLLRSGRELCVKRIQTSPIDGVVEISSDNDQYKSYQAADRLSVNVLGKVLFVFHKL
jgi:hypothetical protein